MFYSEYIRVQQLNMKLIISSWFVFFKHIHIRCICDWLKITQAQHKTFMWFATVISTIICLLMLKNIEQFTLLWLKYLVAGKGNLPVDAELVIIYLEQIT